MAAFPYASSDMERRAHIGILGLHYSMMVARRTDLARRTSADFHVYTLTGDAHFVRDRKRLEKLHKDQPGPRCDIGFLFTC